MRQRGLYAIVVKIYLPSDLTGSVTCETDGQRKLVTGNWSEVHLIDDDCVFTLVNGTADVFGAEVCPGPPHISAYTCHYTSFCLLP